MPAISPKRKLKITDEIRAAYEQRNKALDKDPDAPTRPLEVWANAQLFRDYRPLKTAVSVRIDNDVLNWLKSKGEGHLTRINTTLRAAMLSEAKRARRKKVPA